MKMAINKTLIGVITTISILLLVSFTTVVGVNDTSSKISNSPLFSVRTKNAINQKQNILTNNYVGKGRVSLLSIPTCDNRISMLRKAIDRIGMMNDGTFNRFIEFAINKLRSINYIDEEEMPLMIEAFQYMHNNPNDAKNSISDDSLTKGNWTLTRGRDLCLYTLAVHKTPIHCYVEIIFLLTVTPIFLFLYLFGGGVTLLCYPD